MKSLLLQVGFVLTIVCPGVFLSGCGGGSDGGGDDAASIAALASEFQGLESVTREADGTWLLRWKSIDARGVVYAIYMANQGSPFQFEQPLQTVQEDIYRYVPDNIFEETVRCFVVRISNFGDDANETSHCTTAQPLNFAGIAGIERQNDGGYLLTWPEITIKGIRYAVYESIDDEAMNYELPAFDAIQENFYKTKVYERGHQYCFVVRYFHPDLPADQNTTRECIPKEPLIDFGGITKLSALSPTEAKIEWKRAASDEVTAYRIYQGSDFKEDMGSTDAGDSSFSVSGLVPGRQYSFGVRAVDAYKREDLNIRIISIVMPPQ